MKTLVFLIFTLGLTLLNEPGYKSNISITDDNVKIVFNENLTVNDLAAIKLELEQRDIDIAYNNMQFDAFGKLKSLNYDITTSKGYRTIDTYDLSEDNDHSIPIEKM